MNNLSEFLKAKRTEQRMSVREFAKVLRISHSYLVIIERGYDTRSKKPVAPTIEILNHIAHGLGITLVELLYHSNYIDDCDIQFAENSIVIKEFLQLVTKLDLKSIKIVQTLEQSGMKLTDINNALKSLMVNSQSQP